MCNSGAELEAALRTLSEEALIVGLLLDGRKQT
jgi:hypothetical protein